MIRILVAVVLALVSTAAYAVSCVCTTGCTITADPYPPSADQPTHCSIKKAGSVIATAPVVPSTSVQTFNNVCAPPGGAYNAGPAGSVSCLVPIGPQPFGAVTIVGEASNDAGPSGDSAPFTFTNVAVLPKAPPVMTNLRIVTPKAPDGPPGAPAKGTGAKR